MFRRWRRRRRVRRAGNGDLHGRGGADEHRLGAARTAWCPDAPSAPPDWSVSVPYQGPQEPSACLAAPAPRCRSSPAGQRDHGKRCGLGDFAHGHAAAQPDQRLLGQVSARGREGASPRWGSSAHGRITAVAAMSVNNIVGAGRRHGTR
ncbi:hypothetical protein I552_3604 [Mycobacterium xenopi 3993]|nr:hypothetical protein I552_3604 [Mycobacterium xenopi 3993]